MDYRFGAKKNWRSWQWNRIQERLRVPARDAVVVYLAGIDNLDGPVAIRRGFRSCNMIAVENDASTVAALRAAGVLTVHGDLLDVLWLWGESTIDVVVADFCSGLEKRVLQFFWMGTLAPCFRQTVFALNLQRGRDPSSNAWRAAAKEHLPNPAGYEKHRGRLVVSAFTARMWQIFSNATWAINRVPGDRELRLVQDDMRSVVGSYRSSAGMFFDSAVFRSPFSTLRVSQAPGVDVRQEIKDMVARRITNRGVSRIVRQIAAVRAHRTMRMRGQR